MPKKAKDETKLSEEKKVKKGNISKNVDSKKDENNIKKTSKTTNAKQSTAKISKSTVKKSGTKKSEVTKAKERKTSKSTSSKTTQKTSSKISKTTTGSTKKNSNRAKKIEILEYYDLPYRYNETVVKVLAQTPNILFVYWDISDVDKENYIRQYGEYFFNDTKPVLIVYNDTLNYSFEVDINDFANSWYLQINDSNCDYHVELGRRPINKYAKIDNYLYVSSSNNMDAPNDHILFDSLNDNVYFKNVKTNITTKKDISLSFFSKIGKIYNVKDFYKKLYKDENINFERLNLKNMPSS